MLVSKNSESVYDSTLRFDPLLRNTVLLEDTTSFLDLETGIIYYRDLPLPQIADLPYEVVAQYILNGKELISPEDLLDYRKKLSSFSTLPEIVESMINSWNPKSDVKILNILASCISVSNIEYSEQALVQIPLMVGGLNQRLKNICPIEIPLWKKSSYDYSIVEHFLGASGLSTDSANIERMSKLMVIHAACGSGSPSTNSVKVTASTNAKLSSAITSAICTLSGELHGGANLKALDYIEKTTKYLEKLELLSYKGSEVNNLNTEIRAYIDRELKNESIIYGFGHPALKKAIDCRVSLIKDVINKYFFDDNYSQVVKVAQLLETEFLHHPEFDKKAIYPNVDFYSGCAFKHIVGFEHELMTALFASSRIPGWCAAYSLHINKGVICTKEILPDSTSLQCILPQHLPKYKLA
jgi:citrate synthase